MTGSVSPRVSVCIPVYNGSSYIAEAIQSVLDQTYAHFRLIVCDNCSTDNTEEIVRGFRDPRVTFVKNEENLGPVGNANRCLELAYGEYVCIFHHDDVMLPENLERKVRILDEHPRVGFVHSNVTLIDTQGEIVSGQIWKEHSRRDYIEDGLTAFDRFLSSFHLSSGIFIGAVLARRTCYEHVGGFNPALPHCNDGEMWMRMLLSYDVACIGTPLVKYRVHPASASTSWGDYTSLAYIKEHYLAATMVLEKYEDRIRQADIYQKQVPFDFAVRILACACSDFNEGRSGSGRMCFKEALRICPGVYKSPLFWKTAARWAAGPAGVRLYNEARNRLRRRVLG